MARFLKAKDVLSLWWYLGTFLFALVGLLLFLILAQHEEKTEGLGLILAGGGLGQVIAPYDLSVDSWLVEEGQKVSKGTDLVLVRPHQKIDSVIKLKAAEDFLVAEIVAYPQTSLNQGQALLIMTKSIDPAPDFELLGFVSSLEGKRILPGMSAQAFLSVSDASTDGYLLARVKKVGKLPMSKAAIQSLVKIPELAKFIKSRIEAEPFLVTLSLIKDDLHPTGYQWSGPGGNYDIDSGIIAKFFVVRSKEPYLSFLFPLTKKILR